MSRLIPGSSKRVSIAPYQTTVIIPTSNQKTSNRKSNYLSHIFYDDIKDGSEDSSPHSRRRSSVFLLVVGIIILSLGIGVTWYGGSTDLRDFLIIGPVFIIIGSVLFISSVVFMSRMIYYRRKNARSLALEIELRDIRSRKLSIEYGLPKEIPKLDNREPTDMQLYGKPLDDINENDQDLPEKEAPKVAKPVLQGASPEHAQVPIYHIHIPKHKDSSETKDEGIKKKTEKTQKLSADYSLPDDLLLPGREPTVDELYTTSNIDPVVPLPRNVTSAGGVSLHEK